MFEFIYNYVDKEEFTKYLRLTIVISFYFFCRHYYTKWATQHQIKRQIAMDNQEKLEKPEREKKEREAEQKRLEDEAASFGWGKKTRRNLKVSEAVLNDQLMQVRERHQSAYDAAEDHDIEDLLEE
ncbi:uncharacterized protein KQ657_000965 [Scheffersomyces spartinae]|uniref:Processing of GAS1 and ALP protein 2 n=1 Tax=Scheffersomyces spartinae TaxID=45513 RepID=A0A9P7V8W4_9ASCO|nr:uncharacterized protein KQ657_000965 [Scheffersomyces spartinae]KAG7193205.1 hypothetical protein KQ657_000965 [Scheffersomyces spartinae]